MAPLYDLTRLFHGEHIARTAKAGLNFIGNKQDAVLITELPQLAHIAWRGRKIAALAQNGLDQDGARILGPCLLRGKEG